MYVLGVAGSPRLTGNSATLLDRFLSNAKAAGAETEKVELAKLSGGGCTACAACKGKSRTCVIEDDFAPVLDKAARCDVLVLGSPVYFSEVSAQFKLFFDRTYSYLNPDFSARTPKGRKALLILSQGQPDPDTYADIFPRYEQWLKVYGFEDARHMVITGAGNPTAAAGRPELLEEIDRLAADMVGPVS
jgi:multimeric flavodoxin WrbA